MGIQSTNFGAEPGFKAAETFGGGTESALPEAGPFLNPLRNFKIWEWFSLSVFLFGPSSVKIGSHPENRP